MDEVDGMDGGWRFLAAVRESTFTWLWRGRLTRPTLISFSSPSPELEQNASRNNPPTNEQHKKWRSLCELEPLPSPQGEGEWQGRWFGLLTMTDDCKRIMRGI